METTFTAHENARAAAAQIDHKWAELTAWRARTALGILGQDPEELTALVVESGPLGGQVGNEVVDQLAHLLDTAEGLAETARAAIARLSIASGALETSALPPASPTCAALFAEWRAHSAWLNSSATNGLSDETFTAHTLANAALIERLVEEPARDLGDLALKMMAVTDFGTAETGFLAGRTQLASDVRALIGEPA